MYLIIDTENSGLFDFKKPADDPCQPRLAHLAMIFADANAQPERELDFFIRPDGWEMTAEATKVNNLTTEFLLERGVPVEVALEAYRQAILEERIVVAYNAQFDCKQIRGEFRRLGLPDLFEQTRNVCCMRGSMGTVAKQNGKGGFPSLADACAHFGIVQESAHNAVADARACLQVFQQLLAIGKAPAPAVHYAKNPPPRNGERSLPDTDGPPPPV